MKMHNPLNWNARKIVPVAMQIQTIANPVTVKVSSCQAGLLISMSMQVWGKIWKRTETRSRKQSESGAPWAREYCHLKRLLTQGVIWISRGFAFLLPCFSCKGCFLFCFDDQNFPISRIPGWLHPCKHLSWWCFLRRDFPTYWAVRAHLGEPNFSRTRLCSQRQTLTRSFHPPHVSRSCQQTDRQRLCAHSVSQADGAKKSQERHPAGTAGTTLSPGKTLQK